MAPLKPGNIGELVNIMWYLAGKGKSNMQIKYVYKMGNENKPFTIFSREEIPDDILEIIPKNESFRESTTFAKKA